MIPSPTIGSVSVRSMPTSNGQPGTQRVGRERVGVGAAGRLDRVDPRVAGVDEPGAEQQAEPAGIAEVEVLVVLLVGADDDLGFAVAVDVADRRRVDDRPLHQRVGAGGEGDRVRVRVDRGDLGRVDDEDREAGGLGGAAGRAGSESSPFQA